VIAGWWGRGGWWLGGAGRHKATPLPSAWSTSTAYVASLWGPGGRGGSGSAGRPAGGYKKRHTHAPAFAQHELPQLSRIFRLGVKLSLRRLVGSNSHLGFFELTLMS
jgi:hypothetical protein